MSTLTDDVSAQGYDILVVGGGLSSARAIRSYREAGGGGAVALFSRDDVLPYHRPPLSKRYLRGEQEREAALVEPDSFYAEHGVDVLLETTVERVDPGRHEIELVGGRRVRYGKLLLASGATPRRPTAPGSDLEGVFTLRTMDDSTAIRDAARVGRRAVVLGAGFIGMEVAASLRHVGLEVSLINRGGGLFELLGAPELERQLISLYERNDVQLVLSDEAAAFHGRSRVESVETKTRRSLPADLVVAGLGVEPAVGFLESSGLQLDNGVVVDERFAASAPDVYAVGDVARFWDPVFERHRRIEHWSNANLQGAEVGKVLAGGSGGYDAVSSFFTEIFGITLKVFGEISDHDELILRGSIDDGALLGLYVHGRRLIGALAVGQDEAVEERLKAAIRARADVPDTASEADSPASLAEAIP